MRRVSFPLVWGVALLACVFFVPEEVHQRFAVVTQGILVASVVLLAIHQRSARALFAKRHLPLWLFVLALLVSVLGAHDKAFAFQMWRSVAIPLAGFYFLAHELFLSDRALRQRLVMSICFFGATVSLIGLVEWLAGSNIIYEHWVDNFYYERYVKAAVVRQPLSTQSNPTALASILVGALPFSVGLAGAPRARGRVLGALSVAWQLIVIVLTCSRAAFFGMVCALGFSTWFREKRWTVVLLMAVMMFVTGLQVVDKGSRPPSGFDRLAWRGFVHEVMNPYRRRRVVMAVQAVQTRPVSGIGMGHVRRRFEEFSPGEQSMPQEYRIADNMYLTLLAETGLMGLGCFGVFIGSLIWRGFGFLRHAPPGDGRHEMLVPLAGLIGLLVSMLGYDLLYWNNPLAMFGFLGGMLIARIGRRSDTSCAARGERGNLVLPYSPITQIAQSDSTDDPSVESPC